MGRLRRVHVDRGSSGLDGDGPRGEQGCSAQEGQISGQEEGRDLLGMEGKISAAGSEGRGTGSGVSGLLLCP